MIVSTSLILVAVGEQSGIAIAIAGMVIVGVALSLISLFIASLPRVLAMLGTVWPETADTHGKQSHPESLVADDEAVLAAIGFVLHTEVQRQLAIESGADRRG
ncbi:MAG: hypothetical protein MI861_18990 [Pirellulales bacterium]|nr:hypothetical protein [Pirellulales bacterium]